LADGTGEAPESGAIAGHIEARLPLLRQEIDEGSEGGRGQSFHDQLAVYVLAPVATGSKFFGVLVASRPHDQSFSASEMTAIASFAMQAAIGINDCRLHDHYDDIQTSLDDVLGDLTNE
jgi:GAF domain-containing protein